MSSYLQLLTLFFNFFYGVLTAFNFKVINKLTQQETFIVSLLINLLIIVDFTVVYLVVIYKLNYGIFHFYYLIFIAIGMSLFYFIQKRVNFLSIIRKLIDRTKS